MTNKRWVNDVVDFAVHIGSAAGTYWFTQSLLWAVVAVALVSIYGLWNYTEGAQMARRVYYGTEGEK